jgi:calcineurin-like phosphoesterase family protein
MKLWVRAVKAANMCRCQHWHRAHNLALMDTFQAVVLAFLEITSDVRLLKFSNITNQFDRLYVLADFTQQQHSQRTDVVLVCCLAMLHQAFLVIPTLCICYCYYMANVIAVHLHGHWHLHQGCAICQSVLADVLWMAHCPIVVIVMMLLL